MDGISFSPLLSRHFPLVLPGIQLLALESTKKKYKINGTVSFFPLSTDRGGSLKLNEGILFQNLFNRVPKQ